VPATVGSVPSVPGRVLLGLPTLRVSTAPIYDPSDGER